MGGTPPCGPPFLLMSPLAPMPGVGAAGRCDGCEAASDPGRRTQEPVALVRNCPERADECWPTAPTALASEPGGKRTGSRWSGQVEAGFLLRRPAILLDSIDAPPRFDAGPGSLEPDRTFSGTRPRPPRVFHQASGARRIRQELALRRGAGRTDPARSQDTVDARLGSGRGGRGGPLTKPGRRGNDIERLPRSKYAG